MESTGVIKYNLGGKEAYTKKVRAERIGGHINSKQLWYQSYRVIKGVSGLENGDFCPRICTIIWKLMRSTNLSEFIVNWKKILYFQSRQKLLLLSMEKLTWINFNSYSIIGLLVKFLRYIKISSCTSKFYFENRVFFKVAL